jgi:hypothetical protein
MESKVPHTGEDDPNRHHQHAAQPDCHIAAQQLDIRFQFRPQRRDIRVQFRPQCGDVCPEPGFDAREISFQRADIAFGRQFAKRFGQRFSGIASLLRRKPRIVEPARASGYRRGP